MVQSSMTELSELLSAVGRWVGRAGTFLLALLSVFLLAIQLYKVEHKLLGKARRELDPLRRRIVAMTEAFILTALAYVAGFAIGKPLSYGETVLVFFAALAAPFVQNVHEGLPMLTRGRTGRRASVAVEKPDDLSKLADGEFLENQLRHG